MPYLRDLISHAWDDPNADIINRSFESPVQRANGYTYDPTGAGIGWTFLGYSGIAAIGSPLSATQRPTEPGGIPAVRQQSRRYFPEYNGADCRNLAFIHVPADMSGRAADPFTVSLGSTSFGTFVNNSTSWSEYTTAATLATSAPMLLTFASQTSNHDNLLTVLDDAGLTNANVAPEPATLFLLAVH